MLRERADAMITITDWKDDIPFIDKYNRPWMKLFGRVCKSARMCRKVRRREERGERKDERGERGGDERREARDD